MDFSILENRIDVEFKNKNLLKEALTHRSYINENPSWGIPHNERLEFLGDAVLELAVTENLFRQYPDYPEGELTNIRAALVNYQILAKLAKEIKLDKFIFLSKGEARDTDRAKEVILANAFESLIGAIYLDKEYETAAKFIKKNILSQLPEIIKNKTYKDPKSLLQEIIQERMKITPRYEVLEEEGPDHQKIFNVGVYFGNEFAGQGKGFSKQEAEIEAAKDALHILEKPNL
ncbi:MAG: ribonuclease III [Patescibacteria group bacterium]|nr:ribonuclease III [Patescibacteria group bacterium]